MKHYKSVEFLQIFECQAPLRKRKVPLLKSYWRRFCTKGAGTGKYLRDLGSLCSNEAYNQGRLTIE